MVIGIDARFAVRNRRGIGNYTLRLIRALADIDKRNDYILYTDRDDSEGVLPDQKNFKIKKLPSTNYFLWEQFILPVQVRKNKPDVLHCTGNTAPLCLNGSTNLVLSIHDVMYLKDYSELAVSPSVYQRLGRIYRRIIVPKAAKKTHKVITVSEYSKNDIIRHLQDVSEDKIVVTYEAADGVFKALDRQEARNNVASRIGIEGDYILALGGIDPRKNTELIIRVYIELKNQAEIHEKLVIVGVPDWRRTKFFKMVENSPCREEIIFADFMTRKDLVLLYNGAVVFVYPSLYEGFGIPPLEAMACGVPVISSNTTSIPEVVADAALLINPIDGEELKRALIKLLNDESLRNELVKRGFERVRKFSWTKMAEETLEVYKAVHRG